MLVYIVQPAFLELFFIKKIFLKYFFYNFTMLKIKKIFFLIKKHLVTLPNTSLKQSRNPNKKSL